MMWRSFVLALTLSTLGFPQDPPPPDRVALYKELQEKMDASLPISATMSIDKVDTKGVKTIQFKATLHVRLRKAWVFLELQDTVNEGPPSCLVMDGNHWVMSWPKGGSGHRLDMRPVFKALLNLQWRFDQENRKVIADADPQRDFDGFVASR